MSAAVTPLLPAPPRRAEDVWGDVAWDRVLPTHNTTVWTTTWWSLVVVMSITAVCVYMVARGDALWVQIGVLSMTLSVLGYAVGFVTGGQFMREHVVKLSREARERREALKSDP